MPPSSILAQLRSVVHRSDIAVALLFVGALRYRISCRHHANSLFLNVCWHCGFGFWRRQIAWTVPFPLVDRTESSNRLPCTVGTSSRAHQEAWHCPRGPWGAVRRCTPPVDARPVCRRGRLPRAAFQSAGRPGARPSAVVGQSRRSVPCSVVRRLSVSRFGWFWKVTPQKLNELAGFLERQSSCTRRPLVLHRQLDGSDRVGPGVVTS